MSMLPGAERGQVLLQPGEPARAVAPFPAPETREAPALISCIMASRGRISPAAHAIDCFQRQSHAPRELIIATAADDDALGAYVRKLGDPSIRLIQVSGPETPGRLRNRAIAQSRGDLIAVWDDDDLSHPDRLATQHGALADADVAGCFLARVLLWWPARRRLAASMPRIWENTMLVRRALLPAYREDGRPGEDTEIVVALRAACALLLIDRPEAYCYIAHGGNLCSTDHFEMLFDRASRDFSGSAYEAALRGLAATMPVATYAADLSLPDAGQPGAITQS